MPRYRTSLDEHEIRAQVRSKRSVTGHLMWFYRLTDAQGQKISPLIHGPYLTAEDANKAAEAEIEMLV